MIAPEITDHALLRWMERAHGVDVSAWRRLMREEVQAALDASKCGRTDVGPAFVIAADVSAVLTYLPAGWRVSQFGDGIGISPLAAATADAA